ncbi:MAG: hypothetical protein OQJ89_09255 [Kangiellaceae bacterium]|nr:hypothetical protein [Kangiellaceae bacterium]MCW8998379.1 hypothetical protein [Kangiellaceae bacterium]MCW9017139.1 hypothetical protein [Kangiellaceae bacterium]
MPHFDAKEGIKKAKFIQNAAVQHSLYKDDLKIEITLSPGIAELNENYVSFVRLLKDTDDT